MFFAKLNAEIAKCAADGICISCGEPFKQDVNVFTELGWQETDISGLCESCFESMFEGMDDED